MTTLENVTRLIADLLDREPAQIRPGDTIVTDLGLDSFDLLDLRFSIEAEFSVYLRDEDLENLSTVQALADLIDELVG